MDEDIAFIKRMQSYLPIAAWNLCALVCLAIFLSPPPRNWKAAALTVVIATAGNFVWLRRRAVHKDFPSRFLNIEGFQIACNVIGIVWFGIWTIVAFEPWKLVVCAISGLLLAFRLKLRVDKQARLQKETPSSQLN